MSNDVASVGADQVGQPVTRTGQAVADLQQPGVHEGITQLLGARTRAVQQRRGGPQRNLGRVQPG